MNSEKFSLKWNDFQATVSQSLGILRAEEDFFDVTLAIEVTYIDYDHDDLDDHDDDHDDYDDYDNHHDGYDGNGCNNHTKFER